MSKLARLFHSVGEGSALEFIALKAVFVVCALVVQKPSCNSKERDHICHLEHHLKLWKYGALDEQLCEGHVIQLFKVCIIDQEEDPDYSCLYKTHI